MSDAPQTILLLSVGMLSLFKKKSIKPTLLTVFTSETVAAKLRSSDVGQWTRDESRGVTDKAMAKDQRRQR